MVPPTGQWKTLHLHFRNVKTTRAQSEILQTHSTKSKKTTPNFEMKEDIQPWRQKMMAHYLPHKFKSSHHLVRMATVKIDQKAISLTMTRHFLTRICANPDTISKN